MRTKSGSMFLSVFVSILAVFFFFGAPQPAHAVLAAAGPVDPANGFPLFYTDTNGISLAPCLDVIAGGCAGLIAEPGIFNPALPISFPTNFPSEFFYWSAIADFQLGGDPGANVTVAEFALEGAFASVDGSPQPGFQMVFQRKRIRLTGVVANASVTVNHPFGTDVLTADALGVVNFTADLPVVVDFNAAATANLIGPFLTATALPAPPYIGSTLVPQTVTPGPNGATFSITGGGLNVSTNQWLVEGKLFAPVTPNAATITRDALGAGTLNVFFNAPAGAVVVTASGPVGGPALPNQPVSLTPVAGKPGLVSAAIPITAASPPPATVVVTVDGAAQPAITATDAVTITAVTYNAATSSLTVAASSGDKFIVPAPTLTVTNTANPVPPLGTINPATGTLTLTGLAGSPASVTVTSSAGGTATAPVGAPAPPAAVDGGAVGGGGGGGGGGCFITKTGF